jgi:hypothetical protein
MSERSSGSGVTGAAEQASGAPLVRGGRTWPRECSWCGDDFDANYSPANTCSVACARERARDAERDANRERSQRLRDERKAAGLPREAPVVPWAPKPETIEAVAHDDAEAQAEAVACQRDPRGFAKWANFWRTVADVRRAFADRRKHGS